MQCRKEETVFHLTIVWSTRIAEGSGKNDPSTWQYPGSQVLQNAGCERESDEV